MPLPIYVVCSQSGSQDSATRFVSCFGLLEQGRLQRAESPSASGLTMFVVAAWMREAADAGRTYEGEVVVTLPGHQDAAARAEFEEFSFSALIYRMMIPQFVIPLPQDPRAFQSGVMRVEVRIRQKGTGEWIRQSYPIWLEVAPEVVEDASTAS